MPRPVVLVPKWTIEKWLMIRAAQYKDGGWVIEGKVQLLHTSGEVWEIFDPLPDPDPPNYPYPMSPNDWRLIAGGELVLERNAILRNGTYYKVQAISIGEERWAVPVPLG